MSLLLALALAGAEPCGDLGGPNPPTSCQPWFCEDYLAEKERPWPGCIWEVSGSGKLLEMAAVLREAQAKVERLWDPRIGAILQGDLEAILREGADNLSRAACGAERCPPVLSDQRRKQMCTGPTEYIPDDDPALLWFRIEDDLSLEDRKVALAIERVNSCD